MNGSVVLWCVYYTAVQPNNVSSKGNVITIAKENAVATVKRNVCGTIAKRNAMRQRKASTS
jgi:hypothetical protein